MIEQLGANQDLALLRVRVGAPPASGSPPARP